MELIGFALVHDWPVLLPIVLCSVLAMAVALERWWFYRRNSRDSYHFFEALQREIVHGLDHAAVVCAKSRGILAEVASDGISILTERKGRFEQSYDIAAALAMRRVEAGLPILGSIATISPYLGLFGTVVRILITFGQMAEGGTEAPQKIMFGIGSALIATAFGLAVAILSVALNNYFRTVVTRFEDDFQLLKLLLLSVSPSTAETQQAQLARPRTALPPAAQPRRSPEAR
ncbi:MAG: MotA/TolQ/ExbB proton channel family protein [Candidatus Hydrogenedentes bacterium]|nr:MotA/TolQ/ExbB proton channel family protein [Candidatus Hydrogenedentota bacterium]